jgi:hypothetical protein
VINFIISQAVIHRELSLEGGPPLKRTNKVGEHGGQQRVLKAKVWVDIGAGKWANCFRLLAAGVGADYKLPTNGPAKGIRLDWHTSADPLKGPVRFYKCCGNQFATPTKGDSNGESRTGLEGVPQKKAVPESAPRVTKEVQVWYVTSKTPELFDDQGFQHQTDNGVGKREEHDGGGSQRKLNTRRCPVTN